LWNKKQDITQLQPFGALVHVVKTLPKKNNARLNEKDPLQVLTNATPGFLVGYQSLFFNGCKKVLTLQGNIVHSLDVYFRDNDPRDPHDVNPRIFLHPFDGPVHTTHEELISAYDTEGYINMSDAELERRAKLIPIEGTKGKGFVPEEHSLEKILRTFYPNHAWTKARQQLMDLVLQKEEDEDEHRVNGWEEGTGSEVEEKKLPEQAGADKPVEDMPGRRTRGGKSFDQTATNNVNTATIAHPAEGLNQLHHELPLNSVEQQMREREYLRDEYVKQSLSLEVPNIFGFTSMFQKQGGSNIRKNLRIWEQLLLKIENLLFRRG